MNKIDSPGAYRGEIIEAALGTTKKGYPQFIARLKATEKFVEDPADLAYFVEHKVIEAAEPQWVNWADFNEETLAYLVLFNNDEKFDEDSILMNAEQLQVAIGWDATEFESLADGSHVGKKILFRMDEDEYEGKTRLRVNWIDAFDASPNRELRKLATDEVKALTAKLKLKKSKPTVAKPSKLASKATPKAAPAPAPVPEPAVEEVEESFAESVESQQAEEAVEEAVEEAAAPPKRTKAATVSAADPCTQMEAWEAVCEARGDKSDQDATEAFVSGINAVSTERDEDTFTPDEWGTVRRVALETLAA